MEQNGDKKSREIRSREFLLSRSREIYILSLSLSLSLAFSLTNGQFLQRTENIAAARGGNAGLITRANGQRSFRGSRWSFRGTYIKGRGTTAAAVCVFSKMARNTWRLASFLRSVSVYFVCGNVASFSSSKRRLLSMRQTDRWKFFIKSI